MSEGKKFACSRRNFLKYSLEASLAFSIVGAVSAVSARADYVRPPGAIRPEEFTSKCIRCGACQEVCPTKAIRLVGLTRDMTNMDTPYIDPSFGGCIAWKTTCLDCVQVCPTRALSPQTPLTQALGYAHVREKECVNCMVCFRWCPIEGAVHFPNPDGGSYEREQDIPLKIKMKDSPYKPWIDKDKCVGCGLCAHYCIVPCIDLLPHPSK